MIVEKYVNALLNSLSSDDEIVEIYEAISRVSLIANESKFILIVKSPLVSLDDKIKFLSQLAESKNEKLINFFKILLINKRIDLIKEIQQNLYSKVSNYFNTYAGIVEGKINEETLKELEKKLSEKFNANIKLQLKERELNGIKVFVDVLNVEVAIDENRIKNNLIKQILKAI